MNTETRAALAAHVEKLTDLAANCRDEDRRRDAVRSLACLALLKGAPPPHHPDGGGETVIDLSAWRLRLAA